MNLEDVRRHWESNAAAWTTLSRAGYDVYRDLVNTPAFLDLLPDVRGMKGLDVGCGEGSNTREVAKRGAEMCAIDIAPTFVANARECEVHDPLGIHFSIGDCGNLAFSDETFDFVTAFMSLMDMPDQDGAMLEIARVLRPHGFVQFSILHPCFVPPSRKKVRNEDGEVVAIAVADYFEMTEGEVDTWWFSRLSTEQRNGVPPFKVPRFHRTLASWVKIICNAGLVIEDVAEPAASAEAVEAVPAMAHTRLAPLFLHVRARKAA
ncbi:MAG: class I SAM-dependent methyltransferase [Hyphomicrobiaceae bacterium]